MQIISSIQNFFDWRKKINGTVGFVPTMGALHSGHLSLVEKSNELCKITMVSIYVNPAQFGPKEDLDNYPKTLDSDLSLLKNYNVHAVFVPTDSVIYPENFSTFVSENSLTTRLEGDSRPSHFQGVTTIVAKLLNIARPTHAFFGEKDAQQLRIIQKMVEDLNYPIEVVPCPTVREASGLALSSRNQYLSAEAREQASIIYRALLTAKEHLEQGADSVKDIKYLLNKTISSEPSAKIDYISIADSKTLIELENTLSGEALISVAVYFGKARLIDNIVVIK